MISPQIFDNDYKNIMDLIKGLENGFYHTWECGNHKHRLSVFKEKYKPYVDEGKFIRQILDAPRDARYKIDHYYNEKTEIDHTVPYPYLGFFEETLKYLNLDETFNWKESIVDNKDGYTHNDITILYHKLKEAYYFKYKGDINTLIFNSKPELVNYSDPFWKKCINEKQYYFDVGELLHNIGYFLEYKGLMNDKKKKDSIMEYESQINELLRDLLYEDWMDEEDYVVVKELTLKSQGITMEKLNEQMVIGVENGWSVEKQIAMLKLLLNGKESSNTK